ncbi:conserved hypothetical protein [Vibrio chagasii]|nr:conserved hypothetical protein [Vibrio chagasii]CAH6981685.1 conserved hypothetical protein [Vibrio chagasii]CAH7024877.1 conserved hypothetical protein [Vibrio chagasii]
MRFIKVWVTFNALILTISIVTYSSLTMANVPAGFEDLYKEKSIKMQLVLAADKTKRFDSDVFVSGDSVRVEISQMPFIETKLINEFGIDNDIAGKISTSLASGIKSSLECKGYRSECGLLPDFYDFVYVPEQSSLIIHVNSLFLEENIEDVDTEFVKDEIDENSVIMQHGLNISGSYSGSGDSTSNYSYKNENYVGFGNYGYVHNDFNYSQTNGFSSDDSSYNYVSSNIRLSMGYKYQERAWNSTNFLENNSKTSGYMVSIGSTKELVKKSTVNSRRVYLNIPRDGRLEITDDRGRVLLSRNVSAGQDYFDYNELPTGTYNTNIKIFDGGSEFYNEERLIVNGGNSDLHEGELDYHVTVGYLSRDLTNTGLDGEANEGSINFSYDNYESPIFTNGKITYQLTDFFSVGGGAFVTGADNYNYLGGNLYLGKVSRLSAVAGLFDDGSNFYNVDFGFYDFTMSYTNFSSTNNNSNEIYLSDLLFSESSYSSLSMNYNKYLTRNVSSYLSGIMTKNEYLKDDIGYVKDSESWSARGGVQISELPLDSKFNFELSASESNDINYGVTATITIPLHQSSTYMHSTQVNFDDSGDVTYSHRDTLSSNIVNDDNLNISSSAGLYYQDSQEDSNNADLSLSMNYENKYIDTNSYAYINSNTSATLSGYIGTNNIITSEGLVFTSNKSSTYFISSNDTGALSSEGKFLAVVNSEQNGQRSDAYVSKDAFNVYPLKEYKEYEFALDTEASDFYNNGDSYISATSYPGTVIRLDTSLSGLKSFISTFSDIDGNPIDSVDCIGEGCVSSDRLVEGVYQFKVKDKMPYKIISKVEQCVIPELSSVENLNLGNNFCMPFFEENAEGYQVAVVDNKYYYYLGQYKDSGIVTKYKNELRSQGVDIIVKDLGNYSYVFAKSSKKFTLANKRYVDELINYAVHMEITPYASN